MSEPKRPLQFPAAAEKTGRANIVALSMVSQGGETPAPDVYCSRCAYRWRAGLRWLPRGKRLRRPNCGSREVKVAEPQPPEAA